MCSQLMQKVAIVHHDGAAIAFCSYVFETSGDFSKWDVLYVGGLLPQTQQFLEDLGVRSCEAMGDMRGLEISELGLFPATMSVGNWFVVNTRGMKVQKLIAALDGLRNIGMLGPSITNQSTEIVSFLTSSPDPYFENEVKLRSSKVSQTAVGLDAFSSALRSWCSYFSINPTTNSKPVLSQRDILYIYRDGWNASWAPTLREQFDSLNSYLVGHSEVTRLVLAGPRSQSSTSVSEEQLIRAANSSMSARFEVESWKDIVSINFPESATTSIDVFQHAGYLGTPKFIFQYESTSALNLFAISRDNNTKIVDLSILQNSDLLASPKFRSLLEQCSWLNNLLEGLKLNGEISKVGGVSRDFYLKTNRKEMRRTAMSFILSRLNPKLYNFAARALGLD